MSKLGSCALGAHAQDPLMSSLIKPCTIFMLTHVALPEHVVEMHKTCDKRVWCTLKMLLHEQGMLLHVVHINMCKHGSATHAL